MSTPVGCPFCGAESLNVWAAAAGRMGHCALCGFQFGPFTPVHDSLSHAIRFGAYRQFDAAEEARDEISWRATRVVRMLEALQEHRAGMNPELAPKLTEALALWESIGEHAQRAAKALRDFIGD